MLGGTVVDQIVRSDTAERGAKGTWQKNNQGEKKNK